MTPELVELIKIYNNNENPPLSLPYYDYLKWLKSFVAVWDFRKKQSEAMTNEGEAARWLLKNDEIVEKYSKLVLEASVKLGLIGITDTVLNSPDYILPLGGALISNFKRCELAKTLIDTHNFESKVIALSTMRPLSEQEITFYSNTPAKDAVFEFEAIASGLSTTFDIRSYTEETERKDNYNLNWTIRKYSEKYGNNDIYAISAPSSEPDIRRANSVDCFDFFFKRLNVLPHSNIINCTSQIYCPYQQVRALSFAIKHTVNFDTVGYIPNQDSASTPKLLNQPVNYLQEIKATIDAIYDFVNRFS
ncbi:MAG TPA: hypothetical protein PLB20_02910 [Clostridia bacterium]|nr:hypothetical protein [Clostridia bacterium]